MRITIGIAGAFILERIGRNEIHLALQRAIDGVIIGGQLDRRILILADRGNVFGAHPGLDIQLIFQRDDLQDLFAGPHHAADCGDRQLVHHALHRGHQHRAIQLVLRRFQLLPQRGQLAQRIGIGRGAIQLHLGDHVIQTVFRLGFLFARRRHLDQRGHFHRQHLFQNIQLLLGLFQNLLRPVPFRDEVALPRPQQRGFRGDDIRHPRGKIGRHVKIDDAQHFRLKPQAADFQRCNLVAQIIHRRLVLRAIQPRQNLPGPHDIAF